MLLLWDCFAVTKPLSQIQRSTLWLLQGLSPRPPFGGFGLSDSSEELAEVTRLLDYASGAVVVHVPIAPDSAHNEAVRRLVGYLYDMPEAARGDAYANAMRNSWAARILLAYRVHRAGYSDADAVGEAQNAVGTAGNPVVDVSVENDTLTVTFADGCAETFIISAYTDAEAVAAARTVIADWAESDNDDAIPADKLVNAPGGGSAPTLTEVASVMVGDADTSSLVIGDTQTGVAIRDAWNSGTYWAFMLDIQWELQDMLDVLDYSVAAIMPIRRQIATNSLNIPFVFD